MSQLKIYTKRDKAAFLNKCKSAGITLSTEEFKQGRDKKSNYFIVNTNPEKKSKIVSAFAGDLNFDVRQLREINFIGNRGINPQTIEDLMIKKKTKNPEIYDSRINSLLKKKYKYYDWYFKDYDVKDPKHKTNPWPQFFNYLQDKGELVNLYKDIASLPDLSEVKNKKLNEIIKKLVREELGKLKI